jgi:Putative beta-barrel porin-2, OmpL-like. bbp2
VDEGGIVNYTMHRISKNAFLTLRNEFYDDSGGARTGFATCYYEGTFGMTWWPNKLICVRPEVRFDHSFAASSYNNGTRHSQGTLACDVTYHF